MGKGGRYLNKANKTKKKGRGWKIALIVLAVLAILIGGIAIAANSVLNGMFDKIKRAEVIERDDVSDEDFQYFMTFDPDRPDDGGEALEETIQPVTETTVQTTETASE